MKRLPIWPTLFVAVALAIMIALGVWQLQRASWKEALLARYAAAATQPEIAFPAVPVPDESLLFRKASGTCLEVTQWIARAGADRQGRGGWRHIARCRTGGAEGPGMTVDLGWSANADAPRGYTGGPVRGVLDFDRDHVFVLVADTAAPGLVPSAVPSPANIPNNHRAYAVQWFLFAGVALIIYIVALRRRSESTPPNGTDADT